MQPVYVGRKRLDNSLGHLPNCGAEARMLGCKFEVQLRRYLE